MCEAGFELLEEQGRKELQKLEEYKTMDVVLEEIQDAKEKAKQKEEQEDILSYLRDIALQLQNFGEK